MNIITGELIQECADIYIGTPSDFAYNPRIAVQTDKHLLLSDLFDATTYNNPRIVFCYSSLVWPFSMISHKFENPFILITHKGDTNIENLQYINSILNMPNLTKWYAQNVNYVHDKLVPLPIGIANRMWPHGEFSIIESEKTHGIYMMFDINTNPKVRYDCLDALRDKIPFLQFVPPVANQLRLSRYKYCICPEGNGLDTHRLWEAIYLRVVPILIRSTHVELLQAEYRFPAILLDSWRDLDVDKLPAYESFTWETNLRLCDRFII